MINIYKVLSDPTRREILRLLSLNSMSAGEIADCFDLSKSTISGHLAQLKEADLIDITRDGNTLIYNIRLSVVENVLLSVSSYFSSLKLNGETNE